MLKFKFLILNLLIITSLIANDGFEDEDDEFGGDEVIEIVKLKKDTEKELVVYGSFLVSSNYSYKNKHKISSAKISTNLKFDYKIDKIYKIKSTIKAYKEYKTNIINNKDFDINELSVESTFYNNIDGKIGRQIVIWGKSDNIRITDVLNPLDSTAPGMVDIEDLRLGRFMSKLDYYVDDWSFGGIWLNENRYTLMPKKGSDYYMALHTSNTPSNTIKNSGFALSANGIFQGQDLSFYYVNQYIDNTSYKSNMIGFAYNKVIDSFLLKTELAYFDNYDITTVDARTDSLIGLEYNGINDGSISLEMANKNDDIQYAFRFTQSFINQTLDFTALYSGFGKDLNNGGFVRVWIDYAVNDEISLNLGAIDYLGGDMARFEHIKHNDKIFTSLKYSF